MTMPWTCDALLPTNDRLASLKFKRVAGRLDARALAWDDALELVAFLGIIPVQYAKRIFFWDQPSHQNAMHMSIHMREDAADKIRENLEGLDFDDAMAIFRAMQDGGWRRGSVPDVVQRMVKEMQKRGQNMVEIARELGVTREQAVNMTGYQRPSALARAEGSDRAALFFA